MADFVAVLKKTIDGLSDNTPAMREKVYRKARDTIAAKLAAIDPPPSRIVIERQHKALEDAIMAVEASYSSEVAAPDDFESVLAGLGQEAAEDPGKPQAAALPEFTEIKPADRNGFDLARSGKVLGPEHELPETGMPVANGNGSEGDDALVPITPVRRPEPPLAKPLAGDGAAAAETAVHATGSARRGISGGLIAAAIVVIVVGAGSYGIWLNRAEFGAMLGFGGETAVAEEPAEVETEPEMEAAVEPTEPEEPVEQEVAAAPVEQPTTPLPMPPAEEMVKFTQRLTADGQEVDAGPAGGEASIGEGTSLASATQIEETPAAQPASAASAGGQQAAERPAAEAAPAVPVGQRAIFYEERTNVAQGSAETGTTVWSLVQESPGGDLPPEPAIRAEVTVPAKDIQLRMTIRRNGDKTLPASHIVEMIFLTSGTFEGGGVDNVLRIALKNSEAAPGSPLIGIPAKIADGYFLVALSDGPADRETNTQLLLRQSWIDIPIVYRSGRRALVTMEKGVPGDRVFQEALQAWRSASSG
jgi:hypothetical protein